MEHVWQGLAAIESFPFAFFVNHRHAPEILAFDPIRPADFRQLPGGQVFFQIRPLMHWLKLPFVEADRNGVFTPSKTGIKKEPDLKPIKKSGSSPKTSLKPTDIRPGRRGFVQTIFSPVFWVAGPGRRPPVFSNGQSRSRRQSSTPSHEQPVGRLNQISPVSDQPFNLWTN
jgi:hypothetical protein